jgi:hypothetical protein
MRDGPRLCSKWGLSKNETTRLLSDDQDDRLQRTGTLMGIHVALMMIFAGDTEVALST